MADFFASIPAMIILTGALVGMSGALLGTFLVLRGTAMQTDAIAHAIVPGIVLVWMATGLTSGPVQVAGAALAGVLAVALAEGLARQGILRMDAALGLVFTSFFAAGVLLINLNARNLHLDVHSVLLGEIGFVWLDTVTLGGVAVPRAVLTLALVFLLNLGFVLLLWKELTLSSFDPALAQALGLAPRAVGLGLSALTAVTAVAAFEAVGVILFLAFVIVPPATALLLSRKLPVIIALALGLAVLASVSGYHLAVQADVSIGGTMALVAGAFFAAAMLFAPRDGLLARARLRAVLRLDRDASALVAHLDTHAATRGPSRGSSPAELRADLHWSRARLQAATLRALDRGLITREGEGLRLSPKGQAQAQDL
jgi:manganese/zinc/iron transport system permease protein